MTDPDSPDVVDVSSPDDWDNGTVFIGYYFDETSGGERVNTTMTASKQARNPMADVVSIAELNSQKVTSYISIFVILGCIVALGVLTNFLVCYIYRCRSRRATSNFFVIFFAIFDMVGCFVVIPFELSALAMPYTYNNLTWLCKVTGFLESCSVCCLCLTLICVAYDCYRKFCRPGEDFGVKKAKICCIISLFIAVLVSIPALAVFGVKEVKTKHPSLKGEACSVDPTMPQWLRIMYNVCILGTFTLCLCAISALYGFIGVAWCRQRQAEERGEKPSPAKQKFPKKHRFVREETSTSSVTNYSEEIARLHSQGTLSHSHNSYSDSARVPLKSSSGGVVKTNSLQASSSPPTVTVVQLHVKNTRQTSIFIIISIIFVVSMLPYVVVMILCAATPVFNQFSSNATEIVFNLCIRSYLLNYLVKPVVYFIFNVNFRKEVKQLFNKVWAFCTGTATNSELSSSNPQRRSFIDSASRSASRTPIYRPPRNSN
ncbi:unnamed protein product [Lymnaea stagnalis]|uniref:G-protein coupled receptors family 1 profile domain-containing protein n=1 Tax=Lymnaea stagnalis TaxID=6523 RepID=A0AAV2HDC2_LYMST